MSIAVHPSSCPSLLDNFLSCASRTQQGLICRMRECVPLWCQSWQFALETCAPCRAAIFAWKFLCNVTITSGVPKFRSKSRFASLFSIKLAKALHDISVISKCLELLDSITWAMAPRPFSNATEEHASSLLCVQLVNNLSTVCMHSIMGLFSCTSAIGVSAWKLIYRNIIRTYYWQITILIHESMWATKCSNSWQFRTTNAPTILNYWTCPRQDILLSAIQLIIVVNCTLFSNKQTSMVSKCSTCVGPIVLNKSLATVECSINDLSAAMASDVVPRCNYWSISATYVLYTCSSLSIGLVFNLAKRERTGRDGEAALLDCNTGCTSIPLTIIV